METNGRDLPLRLEGELTLLDQPGRYWGIALEAGERVLDVGQEAARHFGVAGETYALPLGRVRITVELLGPEANA